MGISKNQAKNGVISLAAFLAEWTVFGLLALAASRPLADSWTTSIPQGVETSPTVPLFNLWTMGWNIDRLEAGLVGYWDAPIFHPAESAFAFSEPQPLMMLMAPVLWLGGTLPAAYNLYFWLGLSLTGVITSRFLRWATPSGFVAWTGGAMMVMLPFVHWQSGSIQLTPLFGVVGTIFALARFGKDPSVPRSLLLGFAFAVTYLLCNYYGLFLSLLLILSGGWLLGRNFWNWRTWVRLVPGAALCLLLAGPVIYQQQQVLNNSDWDRDLDYVRKQSAKWGDFTATPWPQILPIPEFVEEKRSGWTLSPGYLKIGLAILGLAWGLYHKPFRRLTLFLMTFTTLGVLLAMGPRWELANWVPYETLREYYPGLKKIRNAFRFVVFAQIGIVLLAAMGFDALWRQCQRATKNSLHLPGDLQNPAGNPMGIALLMGLSFLVIVEVWPNPQRLYKVPDSKKDRPWITWIQKRTDPANPLACIPFPQGRKAKDYLGTTVWMYHGLRHGRPLLNGYSGFFPPQFLELKASMANFPDAKSLKLLEENGARYCVIRRTSISRNKIEQHPEVGPRLKWRFADDEAKIDIYEIPLQ